MKGTLIVVFVIFNLIPLRSLTHFSSFLYFKAALSVVGKVRVVCDVYHRKKGPNKCHIACSLSSLRINLARLFTPTPAVCEGHACGDWVGIAKRER